MKNGSVVITLTVALALALAVSLANGDESEKAIVKKVKGKKVCIKGWECPTWSKFCCNETISDYFQVYQFENLFSKRNTPVAHAVGFWDYQSFITATIKYQPLGFGTTGTKLDKMKEISAFLAHVGYKTSCKLCIFFSFFCIINSYLLKLEDRSLPLGLNIGFDFCLLFSYCKCSIRNWAVVCL